MLTEGCTPKTSFPLIVISIIVPLMLACNVGNSNESENIDGLWNIVAAKRNAKETTTLRDGFFQFDQDSIMSTNIFGAIQSFSYLREGARIQQLGDQQVEYQLEFISDDTLMLSAMIYSYDFDFIAVRDSVSMSESLDLSTAE